MANSPQAKKRARQNEKRFAINKARRSRIRTYLRKVEEAITSGDKEAATAALKAAQPELMREQTARRCPGCAAEPRYSSETVIGEL